MNWTLRYMPASPLGAKFPTWRFGRFRSQLAAQDARNNCSNPDQIEVVEVES